MLFVMPAGERHGGKCMLRGIITVRKKSHKIY